MRSTLARWRAYRSDVAVLLAGILTLLASCVVISSKKYFWNDELYSWYFVGDASFTHMWAAFGDKINNTPALYFVLGWLWVQVAGASELSLRLFSSLGLCAAMVIVWATLRKVYPFWPTCVGTLAVFLTSDLVLVQNAEARMYGLYLGLAAAAVYQFVSITGREGRYSRGDLICVALVHAAIVNTHLFGPFYSGAVLAAFAITDWRHRRLSRGVYGAIVAGWATFLLYLPVFRVQADAGNPRSWMPEPTLSDLLDVIGLVSPAFVAVEFAAALLFCLLLTYALRRGMMRRQARGHVPDPMPAAHLIGTPNDDADTAAMLRGEEGLLLVAFLLVSVPVATWLMSRVSRPIFWDRYLMPSMLAYCIVLAHLTARYLGRPQHPCESRATREDWAARVLPRVLLSAFVMALLLNPQLYARSSSPRPRPDARDVALGRIDLPIVVQASGTFLQRRHYAERPARYYFVLDRESAQDEASGKFGSQEYKHLDAFKRNYPDGVGTHILDSEEFLRRFDRFLVLDDTEYDRPCPSSVLGLEHARVWTTIHCPQWVERRLLRNPAYRVTKLGQVWDSEALLLVERIRSSLN